MKYFLGIEHTGSQLKIAAFKKDSKGYKLHRFDKLAYSGDSQKTRGELLAWKKLNLPGQVEAQAVISIAESTLFLKELTLPKLSKKQITEGVYWELAGLTPFPKNDMVFDWKELEKVDKKTNILAFSARESAIDEIVNIFEEIGIKILAVEPSILSFERISSADFNVVSLLMTVEHEETNLLVLKKGMPVFTTSISTPIYGQKSGKRRLNNVVINDLAEQAYKTIEFWQAKNNDKVSQAIITGEIAEKYYGLAAAVNKLAKIPSLMASKKKLENMSFSKETNAMQLRYLIPIGAFFRIAEGNGGVNLLPKAKRQLVERANFEQKIRKNLLIFSLVNAVFITFTVIALIFLNLVNSSLLKTEAQKKISVKNHPAQNLISEVNDANKTAVIIDNLIRKQKDIGVRLDKIADLTPEAVSLTAIDFGQLENEEWKIKGVGDRNDILAYFEKLSGEANARNVNMPYSNLSKETDNEFEIIILW